MILWLSPAVTSNHCFSPAIRRRDYALAEEFHTRRTFPRKFWTIFSQEEFIQISLPISAKVYNNIIKLVHLQGQKDSVKLSLPSLFFLDCLIFDVNNKMQAQIDYTKKTQRQTIKYLLLLKNCALNCLGRAQKILEKEQIRLLLQEYEASSQTPEKLVQFQEYFIGFLFGKLHLQLQQHQYEKQDKKLTLLDNDYQQLQAAIQRSQGDVRKHIKIEQQMKLHMDLMEQEIDNLTRKLMMQQNRYALLFQTMKQIENQRKALEKMVKSNQSSKKHSHNLSQQEGGYSNIKGSAPAWIYRATKPQIYGNKLRSSQQDSQNMKEDNEDSNLQSIKIKDAIGKYDNTHKKHNLNHSNGNNYLISIKKLMKTQIMKEKGSDIKRKLNPKQKTDVSLQKNGKLQRSTSVCS